MSKVKVTDYAQYVIIGNSAGAIGGVEGIRRLDQQAEILLLAAEPQHTYSRPLISYLLQGRTDREHMQYRPASFYADNKVRPRLGVSATGIDPDKKQVILANGEAVGYEKLLVATGSSSFVPPVKGLATVPQYFTFMSLADAEGLAAALTPESRVLVVGAGLIGLKCVEGIFDRVKRVTVVDLADRVLSSILTPEAAAIVQRQLERPGLEFILGDCVQEFAGNRATLQNSGRQLEFDVLVMAVGVRPNTALLAEAGAKVDRGVLVDGHCQTSLPDVYAAGDCTQGYDVVSGERKILALLPNAYFQGDCAGANMAGLPMEFNTGLAMNSIGFWGLHIMSAGSYTGEAYVERQGDNYKCLFVEDNHLAGFILVGDVARAGIYTAVIRQRQPLDELDFELLKTRPQMMIFNRDERRWQLGGIR